MIWAGHVVVIAVDGLEKRIQTNQEILSLNLHLEVLWIIAMDGQEFFEFWSTVSSASDLVFSKLVEKKWSGLSIIVFRAYCSIWLGLNRHFSSIEHQGSWSWCVQKPKFLGLMKWEFSKVFVLFLCFLVIWVAFGHVVFWILWSLFLNICSVQISLHGPSWKFHTDQSIVCF